jgi:plasmid maintenance system antidote protein VapI
MSNMFDPPHPGEMLREDVLPEMGLTVTEAASQIGVSRVALSRVLNGVENGGRAEIWLIQQLAYDLWRERQKVA